MMVKPTFSARTPVNKKLVTRIARLSYGQHVVDKRLPGHVLSDEEFAAEIVVLKKNGITFCTPFYIAALPDKGATVACYIPDASVTEGRRSVMDTVVRIERPLVNRWIEGPIKNGMIPSILNQTHITFDFNVSIRTALELGATVWDYPSVDRIAGIDDSGEALLHGFPIAGVQPVKDRDRPVYQAAVFDIQEVYRQASKMLPKEVVDMLLPQCLMVSATVSKTVVGWRNFLLLSCATYESLWLKVQLFKWFDNAARSLFVGCEKVLETLEEFKRIYGLQD